MKILKLRFLNLNSLKGEWEIDFRHPAYANEGIFAITGVTGAGKSTILDAICLALYGATPRLGSITQSNNDIMSRNTGECFSEVVFLTNAKIYQATWWQKRARVKPDGNLQSPKHELAEYLNDIDKGDIIESKPQQTKAKIEEITGMDFSRFTRAMMLAQGNFSAFLQASSDERSPILEQITGTSIYSDISKKVHELCRQAEHELASLNDKISGVNILSDEEESALIAQQNTLVTKIAALDQARKNTEEDKHWRENLDKYQRQISTLTQEKAEIDKKIQAFTPKKQQLERALKALQIAGDIRQFTATQEQLTLKQNELYQNEQSLPMLIESCETAKLQCQDNEKKYQLAETNLKQSQITFQKVRELDTKRQNQQQQHNDNEMQLVQAQQKLAQNKTELANIQQQLTKLKNEQKQQLAKKQSFVNAESLPQTIATLSGLAKNLLALREMYQKINHEKTQLEQACDQNKTDNQRITEQLQTIENSLAQTQKQQQDLENQRQTLLQGQTEDVLNQQEKQLWQNQNTTHELQKNLNDWQKNHQQIQQHHAEMLNMTAQLASFDQQATELEQQCQTAEQHVDTLNQNLQLIAKIQSLSQERERLIKGEPCPLCGSTEHPLIDSYQDYQPTQTEKQLEQAKKQLKTLQNQRNTLLSDIKTTQLNQQNLQQQSTMLSEAMQTLANQSQKLVQTLPNNQILLKNIDELIREQTQYFTDNSQNTLNLDPIIAKKIAKKITEYLQDFHKNIEQYQIDINNQSNDLAQRISQLKQCQSTYQANQAKLSELTTKHNQQQQEHTRLETQLQHLQERLSDNANQLATSTTEGKKLRQEIDTLILPFITENDRQSFAKKNDVEQQIQTLQQLWQSYQAIQQDLEKLDEQINNSNQNFVKIQSDEQNLTDNYQNAEQKQKQSLENLQVLDNERMALFGEKNVEKEEQIVQQAEKEALKQWQNSKEHLNDLTNQQKLRQQQIIDLNKNIAQLQQAQTHQQDNLKQQLVTLGFVDENDAKNAQLSDDEREQLQAIANDLTKQQQRNDSLLTEAKQQAQNLQETPRSELSLALLTELLDNQQKDLSEQQSQLGAVNQQLKTNQMLKQNQTQLLAQIKQKTQSVHEWQYLHKLIGSSDGKKFRNFAQGLTFNMMIAHANQQLKKMNNRYLLIADTEQPLSLNVIDDYQGGQIRTSKNLSGGESFIISLALALGLSNMASHKMQVDSLFLDEGFGTLDEDALDTALDTLSNLQQSGKLIGVISHVSALKDRISNQIQVKQQSGGVSKIEGAGVQKL